MAVIKVVKRSLRALEGSQTANVTKHRQDYGKLRINSREADDNVIGHSMMVSVRLCARTRLTPYLQLAVGSWCSGRWAKARSLADRSEGLRSTVDSALSAGRVYNRLESRVLTRGGGCCWLITEKKGGASTDLLDNVNFRINRLLFKIMSCNMSHY